MSSSTETPGKDSLAWLIILSLANAALCFYARDIIIDVWLGNPAMYYEGSEWRVDFVFYGLYALAGICGLIQLVLSVLVLKLGRWSLGLRIFLAILLLALTAAIEYRILYFFQAVASV